MPNSETSTNQETSNSPTPPTIPKQATVNPSMQEDTDLPVKFSFKDYNIDLCEIYKISGSKLVKQVTSELRTASRDVLSNFRKRIHPVAQAGDYAKLFNGLEKDAEMYEIKCSGTKRVFGYLATGVFNIVAITNAHLEVGKTRR